MSIYSVSDNVPQSATRARIVSTAQSIVRSRPGTSHGDQFSSRMKSFVLGFCTGVLATVDIESEVFEEMVAKAVEAWYAEGRP